MVETQASTLGCSSQGKSGTATNATKEARKRNPPLHEVYRLPAPIRTFPLPSFEPSNPVSLFHLASTWIYQLVSPPAREPQVVHHAVWSPETFSVHVSDEKSMSALWQQGFYGKGSLSRSEPNWRKREEVRLGLAEAHVSEILTVQRREERQRAKWERARLEQEAIRQTRAEEASRLEQRRKRLAQSLGTDVTAPVGPAELLALPNSAAEMQARERQGLNILGLPTNSFPDERAVGQAVLPRPGLSTIIATQNRQKDTPLPPAAPAEPRPSTDFVTNSLPNGVSHSVDESSPRGLKRQKSVRFSPKVEAATFQLMDPPSPSIAANPSTPTSVMGHDGEGLIRNEEHLQLMPEEAFFLSFAMGALQITHLEPNQPLSPRQQLRLFRQYSFFPPRVEADDPPLEPDDNFLVHYVVYHHFRSLGWVPRAGIKFGVDWLLYTKGPVFDHAEFGLVVVPSYTDPLWNASSRSRQDRTWYWLHSVVRVLSHVMKSLVLVYVDVPSPAVFNEALDRSIPEALKLYKVREVMVKRWSSNRNR